MLEHMRAALDRIRAALERVYGTAPFMRATLEFVRIGIDCMRTGTHFVCGGRSVEHSRNLLAFTRNSQMTQCVPAKGGGTGGKRQCLS